MKFSCLMLILLSPILTANAQQTFKAEQLKFERVKKAYQEKWTTLNHDLKSKGYKGNIDLLLNAYKTEGKLELWLKDKSSKTYTLFRTYDFCMHSGTLGPKVKENDRQTPEGFYYLHAFNPMSSFHLSLGINYPNSVDLFRTGKHNRPGSDIYIHGNCVTVGCIPLSDDKIKEVYILAVEARNSGQNKIPVNIYPFRMSAQNMKHYTAFYPQHKVLWTNLQQAYKSFEAYKIPAIITELKGAYYIK